ncbi:NADPH-dependent FMN reductase [Sphingomonas sp.]|uniref:NADPH-dependent FMN reductase n=1 Tax=Sphingomonas sp. TaxID=28214 RepID=UPI0025CD394E|nr:NADPH-dependent FMN reductase [Sphingomonas sp.]MBV9529468.1 NAD(P)H-dependent oxidoreductase [Sphingomonas sp.]
MAYRIAIIVGSLREGSLNRKMARAICKLRDDNLDCSMVEIGDLPLYNQDADATPSEQVVRFRQQVAPVDGVLFCTPEYNRGVPGVLKNAIDIGSRPYGQSVWDKKPAAIVSVSPGALGGFGANHQLRQACVFLNMPVMQQPEAYFGHVTDDSFQQNGELADGSLKDLVTKVAHAFHDWVDMIHRSRQALAEDAAHAAQQKEHA